MIPMKGKGHEVTALNLAVDSEPDVSRPLTTDPGVIGAVRQTFSALAFKNGWKIIEVYMKKLIYKGYQWPPYWGGYFSTQGSSSPT